MCKSLGRYAGVEEWPRKRHRGQAKKIKGPDNPTCQRLPIMGNKCCSGAGKEGKTKEVVEDRELKQVVCEELCV